MSSGVDAVLHTKGKGIAITTPQTVEGPALLVERVSSLRGVFKTTQRTSAGTTLVATPNADGGIVLTDLIVSTDKTAGSSVTIQFNDGTDQEVIAVFDSVNAPVAVALSFSGVWQGWANARLEVVTVGNVTANVALGYYKILPAETLNRSDWDAER